MGELIAFGLVVLTAAAVIDVASDGWIATLVSSSSYTEATSLSTFGR